MANKLLDRGIMSSPEILGWELGNRNFSNRLNDFLNNPDKVVGPMNVFANKLKDYNSKEAREISKDADTLRRMINSANKDFDVVRRGLVRLVKMSKDNKEFSIILRKYPGVYNNLKGFRDKLFLVRNMLESIRTKVLKYAK